MNEQNSNAQTKEKRMLRSACMLLAVVMVLCGVLVACKPGIQQLRNALTTAPADVLTAQAIGDSIDITLEKAEGERYMLIPGMPMPQKLTVGITEASEPCWAFVTVQEKNGADEYLTWQIADGWTQLQNADGEPVDGVYYRERGDHSLANWNVLKNDQVFANPETVTKTVLDAMAQQDENQWPRLTYRAWAINRDGLDDPRDAWNVIQQETWKVAYEPINADAGFTAALDMADGLALTAFDVNLMDELSRSVQPVSAMQVSLPVPQDAQAALVLHVLDSHDKIVSAIEGGKAIALHTADGQATIVEALDATVANGMATFTTGSFSTYYVVSGHGSTLENWWEDTQASRYNFESEVYGLDANASENREFVVEPDSTFYLYLNTGGKGPVAGNWAVTSDNTAGRIMMSTAGDGVGKVISVSADAQDGDTLKVKANNWIVTIQVDSATEIIEAAYNDPNYPVYIGITLNATTISIGHEPRVSGYDNNDWVYVTAMEDGGVTFSPSSGNYYQYNLIKPVTGSVGEIYLKENIKTVEMLEGTDDKSVKGIVDYTLDTPDITAVDVDDYIRNIDWSKIKEALLNDSSISSKLTATDNGSVQSNSGEYVLQPYAVKIQTNVYSGWHINACFVPKNQSGEWIYFDDNLDESLGQRIEFLNVPARRPWNKGQGTTGVMYTVDPKNPNSNYATVSDSNYVTLTNGQKLRFVGWNTRKDGKGDLYSISTSFGDTDGDGKGAGDKIKGTDYPLVAGGTLYAFWSSPLDRLEIHKDLIVDGDDSNRQEMKFIFNITLSRPSGLQIESGAQIIGEIFDAADGSLVKQENPISISDAQNYTIKLEFTEKQYGVIYAPKGMTYKVEESFQPGNTDYTLIGSQNATGTIEGVGEGTHVRFINGWKNTTGLLRVSKEVQLAEGQTVENWNTIKFPFTVMMTAPEGVTDPTYTYQRYNSQNIAYGDPITVEGNTISLELELAHNESVVFSGIKEGSSYTVTETVPAESEFTPDKATISGTIKANEQQEAHFINRIVETNGTLTITKAFSGCTPEEGESFVFTVTTKDKDNKTVEVAEVVIYGEGSKTLSVPYGQYTVTEDDSWSWRYTAAVSPAQPVTVSSINNPTVTFTNTKSNPNWLDSSAGVTNSLTMDTTQTTPTPQPTGSSNN